MSTEGKPSGARARQKERMEEGFLPETSNTMLEFRQVEALEYIAYQLFKIREAREQKRPEGRKGLPALASAGA